MPSMRSGGLEATLGLLPVSTNATHLAEGLSASGAAVGLLLRVNRAVSLQVAGRDETLPTQCTSVTPLPSVDEKVDPQVVGLGKALSTVGAGVGPLPRVHPLMQLQGSCTGEYTAAHPAPYWLFSSSSAAPVRPPRAGRGGRRSCRRWRWCSHNSCSGGGNVEGGSESSHFMSATWEEHGWRAI